MNDQPAVNPALDLRDVVVSHDTLLEEELLYAFAETFESVVREMRIHMTNEQKELLTEARLLITTIKHWKEDPFDRPQPDWGQICECLDDLTDALDTFSPPGYYFGVLEGDGACFGYFKQQENEDDQEV